MSVNKYTGKQGFTMRSRTIFYFLLFTFFLAGLWARPVNAQEPTPTDDDVNRVARQLYCPVCESTPLDVCPTEACRQWRDLIRTMLAEGKSDAEIKQYFVAQYGDRVLAEPPNRLAAYLVPGIAIILGALFLARGFQMWLKPSPSKAEYDPEGTAGTRRSVYRQARRRIEETKVDLQGTGNCLPLNKPTQGKFYDRNVRHRSAPRCPPLGTGPDLGIPGRVACHRRHGTSPRPTRNRPARAENRKL